MQESPQGHPLRHTRQQLLEREGAGAGSAAGAGAGAARTGEATGSGSGADGGVFAGAGAGAGLAAAAFVRAGLLGFFGGSGASLAGFATWGGGDARGGGAPWPKYPREPQQVSTKPATVPQTICRAVTAMSPPTGNASLGGERPTSGARCLTVERAHC